MVVVALRLLRGTRVAKDAPRGHVCQQKQGRFVFLRVWVATGQAVLLASPHALDVGMGSPWCGKACAITNAVHHVVGCRAARDLPNSIDFAQTPCSFAYLEFARMKHAVIAHGRRHASRGTAKRAPRALFKAGMGQVVASCRGRASLAAIRHKGSRS